MRKQLYLDIKERLKTVKNEAGEQLFKHFDLWNKQVEFIEQKTAFETPAVFVEFMPMQWKTLGNSVQDCQVTVRLHIITECSADYSPTEQQMLEVFDIIDRVVAKMQNFDTPYMNACMRTQSITSHDHQRYVDNVEEYSCNLRDISAVQQLQSVMVQALAIKQ